MGCGASSRHPPEMDDRTVTWTELSMRIRWSGWAGKSPDVQLTVTDESGTVFLVLHGGVTSPLMGSDAPKQATFSTFVSDATSVGSGKKRRKVRSIVAGGTELYSKDGTTWHRVCSGQAAAEALPAALLLQKAKGSYQIFDDDAHKAADDAHKMDSLVAIVATHGTWPRLDNGKQDMCGDMCYAIKVKPAVLSAVHDGGRVDDGARLLLAMCTEPFWGRGNLCTGYAPAQSSSGVA